MMPMTPPRFASPLLRPRVLALCILSLALGAPRSAGAAEERVFRDLEYVAGGHERQRLDVYLPDGGETWPLLVWVHGGAWRGGSKDRCPARRLLEEGYAVASINYRLSQHAVFPAQIEDCKAAIRWLRKNAARFGYDAGRIGVWGASAGGHLVALLGTAGDVEEFDVGADLDVSSRVQAVVDFFGPTDLTKMNAQAGDRSRLDHDAPNSPESRLIGGPVQENHERAARANPITYISKGDPPFLILHGDQDFTVPIGQSELLHEALKKAGVESTFHVVRGAGHGFRGPEIDALVRSFLRTRLKAAPAVQAAMRAAVSGGEIAGAVTLVADAEKTIHHGAVGYADIARAAPMQADTIFWIASMTKPVTATAILMLQDEGRLSVEDPVAKHLPEFKELRDMSGAPVEVTIRHLLTHTSAMADVPRDVAAAAHSLAEILPDYVSRPVRFPPGTRWSYCQSAINTAARIVEVVSGMSFPEFLDRRLFGPLGMRDTTFYLSEEQLERLATSYRKTAEEELQPAEIFILHGKPATSRDRFPAASGGLFSTAPDYARFCRMVLAGGTFEDRRYLKRDSVELMTSLQTGDLATGFTPGNGWGLGWCVVREPQGVTATLSPGSFGHGGAYGTQAWIDPVRKRITILMVQRANFPNADASAVRRMLHEAAAGL